MWIRLFPTSIHCLKQLHDNRSSCPNGHLFPYDGSVATKKNTSILDRAKGPVINSSELSDICWDVIQDHGQILPKPRNHGVTPSFLDDIIWGTSESAHRPLGWSVTIVFGYRSAEAEGINSRCFWEFPVVPG